MKLDLEMPHTVWVITPKDQRGYKRGFEKVLDGRFYYTYGDAIEALRGVDKLQQVYFTIGEAIIGWPED